MATVVSTPVIAWVASVGIGGATQSASVTATFSITQAWEIRIPVLGSFISSMSNDPTINIFPSQDGGATYDTQAMAGFSIAATGAGASGKQASIALPTGQYVMQILNAGPASAYFMLNTQQILTAYQNV